MINLTVTSNMSVGSPGALKMREFAWNDLHVQYYTRYDTTLEYFITFPEKTKHFGMPVRIIDYFIQNMLISSVLFSVSEI